MQKALALCMTALLLLAGCLGTADDDGEEVLEIIGCDNPDALTYAENVTNNLDEMCVYEDAIESAVVDFIGLIENGPDMDNLTTTVGYTMEVMQQADDEVWHYMETTLVSPDGYLLTTTDNYGDESTSGGIILHGNEIQYTLQNETEDYTVRMKHSGTFDDAFEYLMSGDDEDMFGDMMDMDSEVYWEPYYGGYCEWEGNPDDDSDVWSCKDDESDDYWDTWWYYCELHDGDWFCTDDYGQSSDFEDSADNERYLSGEDGDTEGRQAPQITGIDITQDGEMVTIAVTGDFTDDPETAPYFTLMLLKNGNDPEYAIINIQEENFYVLDGNRGSPVWDYLEDGYGEVHIPTDFLLSGFFDIEFSVWIYGESNQTAVSSQFTFFVAEDDGDDSDDDWWDDSDDDWGDMEVELDDDGNPEASFYTGMYDPMSATITGFAKDETGYTFMGSLNYAGSPFSYLEIHTAQDFTVLGFTMEDPSQENNWVEFMIHDSGVIEIDQSISLAALPYILIDMSDMDDGDSDEEVVDYDQDGYSEDEDCDDSDWGTNPGAEEIYDGLDNDCDGLVDYDDDSCFECWEELWYAFNIDLGDSTYSNTSLSQILDYQSDYESDTPLGLGFIGMSAEDIELIFIEVDTDNSSTLDSEEMEEFHIQIETQIWDEYNDQGDNSMEVFHYYDNCTDEGNYYECWMDEWDHEGDGDYEESHGYNYEDCSQESNGSWMCFAGYADEDNEDVMYYYYDDCNYDDVEDDYLCSVPEGVEVWSNCELESNGTWRCWHDYPSEDEPFYSCTPFVAQNSAGFSIFDNSSLDYSMCGMELISTNLSYEMYEFDNSTFTMPTNLIWEECWMQGNETVCEQGEIYYDTNTTMLWETTHENNYMDCDGDYDNNTSMCTEWIGNITDADGGAFLIVSGWSETVIMYQYDEATQSGLIISVEVDDVDMDPEMWFNMMDANEDGEVTASEWADMANQSGEGMTEDDWNGLLMMIEMYDEDNSSGLNLSEFVNIMENMSDMDDDDGDMDPEMMFNMLDANGDGEVTASEWFDFSNSTDEPMTEDDFDMFAGMMDNYDDDDSGGLDFDEFMTFMSEMEDMEDGGGEDMKMYMVFGVLPFGADIDDYRVELAMCDGTSLTDIECEESVYSVVLSEIMVESEEAAMIAMMTEAIVFVDSDESGTLTSGDYVMINNATLEADNEWNFARLYSAEADSYSDENPMMSMLPGFTGFIAAIGLLGAALIRRE